MPKPIVVLTLTLASLAKASPFPDLLQRVEEQPSVQMVQVLLREAAAKRQAPGILPELAFKGDAGIAPDPISGVQAWNGTVGAEISHSWLVAGQQKAQLELEQQSLHAQLTETRIAALRELLHAEWTYRKNRLAVQQAELEVQTQQLDLKSKQARLQLGAIPEIQVKNAQLLLARAELSLRQQQGDLKKSLLELQRLRLSAPEVVPDLPLPPEGWHADSTAIFKTRKDLLALDTAGQQLTVKSLPEVSLTGSYHHGNSAFSALINQNLDTRLEYSHTLAQSGLPEAWTFKLSARFSLDFSRATQQDLNRQQLHLTHGTLNSQFEQVQASRTEAREQHQQNLELLDLSRRVLQFSQDTLEQEKVRFDQGLVSELAVLQARAMVLKEQQNMLELEKTQLDLGLQLWEVYTWYPQNGK